MHMRDERPIEQHGMLLSLAIILGVAMAALGLACPNKAHADVLCSYPGACEMVSDTSTCSLLSGHVVTVCPTPAAGTPTPEQAGPR